MPSTPSAAPSALRRTLLGALAGCAAVPVLAYDWRFGARATEGQGPVTRATRRLAHFTGVAMELSGRLELRIGDSEDVTVEVEENLQSLIETVVEDGMLRIRPVRHNLNLRSSKLHVVVHARRIERLALGGNGSIEADALRGRRLDVSLGGNGSIDLRAVEVDTLAVSVGGNGDLRSREGRVRRLSASVAGSGDVDLGRVAAEEAKVDIAGSGDVTLWAQRELQVAIAGSGDVKYYGDPTLRHAVVGSGNVRRLGPAPR